MYQSASALATSDSGVLGRLTVGTAGALIAVVALYLIVSALDLTRAPRGVVVWCRDLVTLGGAAVVVAMLVVLGAG